MGNVWSYCFDSLHCQPRPRSSAFTDRGAVVDERDANSKSATFGGKVDCHVDDVATKLGEFQLDDSNVRPASFSGRLPALPADTEELCSKAWGADELEEVFVKAFDIEIMRKDLQTLSYGRWLNDEIVNFYYSLICKRAQHSPSLPKIYVFNTFFFTALTSRGYEGVRRWTKNVNIFEYEALLIPLHLQIHWCLVVVDFKQKTLGFFDSMSTSGKQHLSKIIDYLLNESKSKHNSVYTLDGFDLISTAKVPKQNSDCDCGVFTCQFAEYLSRRAKLNFSQSDINYFRKRMVYEIVNRRLL